MLHMSVHNSPKWIWQCNRGTLNPLPVVFKEKIPDRVPVKKKDAEKLIMFVLQHRCNLICFFEKKGGKRIVDLCSESSHGSSRTRLSGSNHKNVTCFDQTISLAQRCALAEFMKAFMVHDPTLSIKIKLLLRINKLSRRHSSILLTSRAILKG